MPALEDHMVVMQLGRETLLEQWRHGRVYASTWRAGDISIMPAGEASRWRWTVTTDVLHVFLPREFLADAELIDAFRIEDARLFELGRALMDDVRNPYGGDRLYAETVSQVLAQHVLRSYSNRRDRATARSTTLSTRTMRRVASYAIDRLADDVSLGELAAVAGLTESHFCRSFKATTGQPPHRWRVALRLERAKALLADASLSLTDIALACGFSNHSHFTSVFRQRVGVTPSAWRQART